MDKEEKRWEKISRRALFTPAQVRELQNSKKAGSLQTWGVYPKYELRNDCLLPVWKIPPGQPYAEPYYPMAHPTLPSELAKLKEGDKEAVLRFAHRYGFLGFELMQGQSIAKGDPLPWIWSHAHTLRLCFELIDLVRGGAEQKIQKWFDTYRKEDREGHGYHFEWPNIAVGTRLVPVMLPQVKKPYREAAARLVTDLINRNTEHIRRRIDWLENRVQVFYLFSGLVEAAYWQLGHVLATGTVKKCAARECRAYFIQTDKRQRFCPPRFDPWSRTRYAESLCAVRVRMRRNRKAARRQAKVPQ